MAKLEIPIPKAKAVINIETLEILPDNQELANQIKQYATMLGFKQLLSRGMTGAGFATAGLEGDELLKVQEACFKKAQQNWDDLKAGKVRMVGVKKSKGGDRAITTEARRIARELVKKSLKENGEKISHYSAKAITEAADALISENEWITDEAKANLSKATEDSAKVKIDLGTLRPDPKKVADAEAKKAKGKKGTVPLSKLQAGKVKPHAPAHA